MEADVPYYCLDCPHLKYEGEVMVGSPLSGGPEPMYSCKKGRNMWHYFVNVSWKRCPDYIGD